MNILHHIPTGMKRAGSTGGGEWAGPCPWCGGRDRFRVWPKEDETGRFWCRQCDRKGDGIELLRELHGQTFHEACETFRVDRGQQAPALRLSLPKKPQSAATNPSVIEPPGEVWRERAWRIAEQCVDRLWSESGARALAWLRERGLSDEAIKTASLGYHPVELYEDPALWGFEGGKQIYIPRGITIPWVIGSEIWRLNVRRPAGDPKYIGPRGSSNGLYCADFITPGFPIVLVEGEFDAWSAMQSAPDLIRAVATGSTDWSRRMKWIARLLQAPKVLVAFDADEPGEEAARYWTDLLPNALRWRPYWGDANQMLQDGCDVRAWIEAGLTHHPVNSHRSRPAPIAGSSRAIRQEVSHG